jgi:hypothetical protein
MGLHIHWLDRRLRHAGLPTEAYREVECAPRADLTLNPDSAAHQGD